MIEYRNVCKSYGGKPIVKNLNLEIQDGEFIVLIGPSGCGKTTTLKMLNRLIQMDSGEILIDEKNIMKINPEELRKNIGYVIQQIGLFPNMTVEENISIVPKLLKWDKERCDWRVRELMELVDMPYDEYGKKYPNEMSGGQQQRIGVLRALAGDPPIILMDEPFGALDPITRDTLQDEVKAIQRKLGKTVIFVTHDMDEAIKIADRIVFMHGGKILQAAPPEEMLRSPADGIVYDFMGKQIQKYSQDELICSDLMKTKVVTVTKDKKTLECVAIMKRKEINSLVVTDDMEHYEGVLTIEGVNDFGRAGSPIKDIITKEIPTVSVNTPAKTAFEILIQKKADYVVVLREDEKVAGIITKTSMAKALASAVWGDVQ